jgi:hypothetical protein
MCASIEHEVAGDQLRRVWHVGARPCPSGGRRSTALMRASSSRMRNGLAIYSSAPAPARRRYRPRQFELSASGWARPTPGGGGGRPRSHHIQAA